MQIDTPIFLFFLSGDGYSYLILGCFGQLKMNKCFGSYKVFVQARKLLFVGARKSYIIVEDIKIQIFTRE